MGQQQLKVIGAHAFCVLFLLVSSVRADLVADWQFRNYNDGDRNITVDGVAVGGSLYDSMKNVASNNALDTMVYSVDNDRPFLGMNGNTISASNGGKIWFNGSDPEISINTSFSTWARLKLGSENLTGTIFGRATENKFRAVLINGKLEAYLGGVEIIGEANRPDVATNEWIDVGFAYSGNGSNPSGTDTVNIYLNGNLVASKSQAFWFDNADVFHIAGNYPENSLTATYDRVQFYNSTEGAETFQALRTPRTASPDQPVLAKQYSFNDATESLSGKTDVKLFGEAQIANGKLTLNGNGETYAQLGNDLLDGFDKGTIEVWFESGANSNWARLFDFGSGMRDNAFFSPNNGGNGLMRFATTVAGTEHITDGATALAQGAHHLAVSLDSGVASVYLDGNLVSRNPDFGFTFDQISGGLTNQNYLGKSQYNDPYFKGTIDELNIYNGSMNAFDVVTRAAMGKNTTQNAGVQTCALSSGGNVANVGDTVSAYAFDSGYTPTATDYFLPVKTTVSDVTASAFAGQTYVDKATVFGDTSGLVLTHSYDFNSAATGLTNQATDNISGQGASSAALVGTSSSFNENGTLSISNGTYVQLPNNTVSNKESVTFEAWVKSNEVVLQGRVFDIGQNSESSRLFLSWTGETSALKSYAYQQNPSALAGYAALEPGQEYLLTVTKTPTTLNYFVNGNLIGTVAATNPLTVHEGTVNYLGKSFWNDPAGNMDLNEFNIYSGAMGDTQVRVRSTMGPDSTGSIAKHADFQNATKIDSMISQAAGYWNFGNQPAAPVDLSGHGYNFTEINGAVFVVDSSTKNLLNSNGIFFTDSKDRANAFPYMNAPALGQLSNGSFTLMTRVNLQSFENDYSDLIYSGGGDPYSGDNRTNYALSVNSQGQLCFYFNDSTGTRQEYVWGEDSLETNTWYDVAAVVNQDTNTISLSAFDSLSGQLLFQGDDTSLLSTVELQYHDRNDFMFFESPWNYHGNVSGMMDYAGVWGQALSLNDMGTMLAQKVPEPSTYALLILGLAGVWYLRRRTR